MCKKRVKSEGYFYCSEKKRILGGEKEKIKKSKLFQRVTSKKTWKLRSAKLKLKQGGKNEESSKHPFFGTSFSDFLC